LSGYESLGALAATGLEKLFAEPSADALAQAQGAQSLSILTRDGARLSVEGRLFTVPWGEASALALVLTNGEAEERRRSNTLLLAAAQNEIRELKTHVESFRKTDAELQAATREAQRAAAAKAEFVEKISHEIRTPLNAITGFAEVMLAERFGPIGNERYAEYLKDIHGAGLHLVSLLNDLLDLSKIETGQLDLSFANVSLNDLTQQCVGIMQPQASRARIIIRTSLTPGLPDRSQSSVELDQVHGLGRPSDRIDGVRRQRRSGAARTRHWRRHEREGCRGGARAVPSDGDVRELGLRRGRARPAAHQGACRSQSCTFQHQKRAKRRHLD
jgi:signal transduction histidine kinase